MKVNKKRLKKFKRDLKALDKTIIQVGAIGKHADANMSNADLLIIHEFGATVRKRTKKDKSGVITFRLGKTPGNTFEIPARAPVRTALTDSRNLKKISDDIQGLIKFNFNPKTGEINKKAVILGLGNNMVRMIQAGIKKRLPPPNVDSTLARKKGDVPLIDTGQLVNSIDFGVKA